MYLDVREQNDLTEIFLCQKLQPTVAKQLVDQLAHWERHHGAKWLVARLKTMRSVLLSGRADDSVRMHSDKTFCGPFRHVSRLALRNRRGSILADRVLRVYGRWEHQSISREDFLEFAKSVQVQPLPDRDIPIAIPRFLGYKARLAAQAASFNLDLPLSSRKRVPFLGKLEVDTHPLEHFAVLMQQCPNLYRMHQPFFDAHIFRNEAELFDEFASSLSFGSFWDEPTITFDVVGKIAGLTKDRGLKKRFIANPHRFLQMALSRFQDAANGLLKRLQVSLVHDQASAEAWITEKLKEGVRLYSLDLSSATDHFPLWYQLDVVRRLFPELEDDISLWESVCRCQWELPFAPTKTVIDGQVYFDNEVTYTKGQPMGTAPSFAVFTLAHIVLVYSLGGKTSDFRVIGDDIVISDSLLAERYQDAMNRLGVSISLSKSLLGSSRAEFAGRIVDKVGNWPTYKATPIDLKSDPFGPFRQYGNSGAELIKKPFERRVLSLLSKIPSLGPKHCWDPSVLESIDDSVILEIFKEAHQPYPVFSNRPVDMLRGGLTEGHPKLLKTAVSAQKAFALFEESQSDSTGFLGVVGKNREIHPNFVQHVNKMLASGQFEQSDLFLAWSAKLERGQSLLSDTESQLPVSFLYRVGRLLNLESQE